MKKIMVIALIMVASFAGADSWLSVEYGFQIGWVPNGGIAFYQKNINIDAQPFNTTFDINAILFNFIRIGGKAIIDFSFSTTGKDILNFDPTGLTSLFFAGIEPVKGFSIVYEHSCSHPIVSYMYQEPGKTFLDGGYDRIYIEIKGKVTF